MVGNFLEQISEILNQLDQLRESLRDIPSQRDISCTREEIHKNPPTWIYRPRFKPKFKLIPQEQKLVFIKLVDSINLHLKKYSPDNLTNLLDILDVSGNNKKSIIFLLENNVYNTNEVYGDFIVEEMQDHYEIYYFRREEKKNQLPTQDRSIDLEKFIKHDAIIQIQNQFDHLWAILVNEIERCKAYYQSNQKKDYDEKISFIKKLLETKECEYLDFKIAMYDLFSEKKKTKWEQRKEFLKDILSLVNNKNMETSKGEAYIVIGVGEENEKYNGNHRNIDFTDEGSLIKLKNEFIGPKFKIEVEEYYIFGDQDNILIRVDNSVGFDRNIIIKLLYEVGVIYELKKDCGNSTFNVEYYRKGTSFTRDGSIAIRMMQEDRNKILDINNIQKNLKTKRFIQFYKMIANIFNRMVEVDKPIRNSDFKNNANYIYCRYSLKTENGLEFLENNEVKHVIRKAAELLKKIYLAFGYFSSNEGVNNYIHGYYLKFYESNIKIVVNKISIPRSSEDLISEPKNLVEVVKYIVSEIETMASEHNIEYDKEKIDYKAFVNSNNEIKRPNIRLIETYLDFVVDPEISSDDLYDRLNRVFWEVIQYRNLEVINEEEKQTGVKIIKTICNNLSNQTESKVINKLHEILYNLSKIEVFFPHIEESMCLNKFIQFYKEKRYYGYLFDLLDSFGYFVNIEKEIFLAIEERNYELLKRFGNFNFIGYKIDGLVIVKKLQSKQIEIRDLEDKDLKESIRKIIENIEKNIFM